MNAQIVEMEVQKGWGKARLEDGRVMNFDVSVSRFGVPLVGAQVAVELGPSRMGGDKITKLEILPWWEPITIPFLFLGLDASGNADLIFARDGRLSRVSEPLTNASGHQMQIGEMGLLVLELKRGSETFTETRVARWWKAPADRGDKTLLLRLFKDLVVEEWEDWDHPDGCHCEHHRNTLRRDLYLGLDLGVELGRYLEIRDYPVEGPGSAYEEMRPQEERQVRLSRPEQK